MIRAVLEWVSLNLQIILDTLQEQGLTLENTHIIGDGTKGDFLVKVRTPASRMEALHPAHLEKATSLRTAIWRRVGIGLYLRDRGIRERHIRTIAQMLRHRTHPAFVPAIFRHRTYFHRLLSWENHPSFHPTMDTGNPPDSEGGVGSGVGVDVGVGVGSGVDVGVGVGVGSGVGGKTNVWSKFRS